MIAAVLLLAAQTDVQAPTLEKVDPPTLAPVGLTVGVKLGTFQPNIDAEFDDATPYADIFGEDSAWYIAPQVRLLRPLAFLDVGVAASVAWSKQSANAFVDDGDDDTPSSGDELSGGETSIRVTPIALLAVVRFNAIYDWVGLPLVPYVEAGGVYVPWRIGKGDGTTAQSGASLGYRINAGAALRLEALEPAAAKSLATQFGVQSTELSVEWSHTRTRGFRVGGDTWLVGLAVGF